jgi:hypothetical protein
MKSPTRPTLFTRFTMRVATFVIPATLAFAPGAHAAHAADAAAAAPESDLLGAPQTYQDPYGTPLNGKKAQALTNASPTDALLSQPIGTEPARRGGVVYRPVARNHDTKPIDSPEGANAALYRQQTKADAKNSPPPPRAPIAIYKSPW